MKSCFAILMLWCGLAAKAGSYPFYYYLTQHNLNQLLYNPAYAGTTDKLNLHLHSMTGMYKVTGTRSNLNPLNYGYLSFDRPCPTIRGAWGAYVVFDVPQIGGGRYYTLGTGGNYAFRWQINDNHRLQFGAGVVYRRFFAELLFAPDPNLPIANVNGRLSSNHLDFSLGAWYQYKGLNAGLSVTHLGNFNFAGVGEPLDDRYTPVFNAYLGYDIPLTDKIKVEPYLYLATAQSDNGLNAWGENAQFALGAMGNIYDAVFLGLAYNHQSVVSPSLGFQLKKKIRFQGTYNLLLDQPDPTFRYHNFEISLTVQLKPKEKEAKGKKKDK